MARLDLDDMVLAGPKIFQGELTSFLAKPRARPGLLQAAAPRRHAQLRLHRPDNLHYIARGSTIFPSIPLTAMTESH
jgi:hypothetical protein